MRKVAFYIGYGLLPLWAAIVAVWIGSLYSNSSEYWNVAPWLIVVAIPVCAATLGVATVTLLVHGSVRGEPSRKTRMAIAAFVGMNLVLVAIAGGLWLRSAGVERDIEAEKVRVLEFVRGHAMVVERFGTDIGVSIVSYRTDSDDTLPRRYEVSIDTKRPQGTDPNSQYVYAIVGVRASADRRDVVLECLTPLYMGQRDSSRDPCKQ